MVEGGGEFFRDIAGALEGVIHDDSTVHREDDAGGRGALGGRPICLHGESMDGDVDDAGFTRAGGQGDPVGPSAYGNMGGEAVLPGKGIVAPESVKKRGEGGKRVHGSANC